MDNQIMSKDKIISMRELISLIISGKSRKKRCFIIGSGASLSSGIPTGGQMEVDWMRFMEEKIGFDIVRKNAAIMYENRIKNKKEGLRLEHDFDKIEEEWNKCKKNGSNSMNGKYYFDIYKLRYYPEIDNGFSYLESKMENTEPSIGYRIMAHMLADNTMNSNIVITTNFDSLIEDALFLHTDKKPLVINHEALADYAKSPDIKRPIVAKVHRGLFFDPLNLSEETDALKGKWAEILSSVFEIYTPIVIGYSGSDNSLMSLLENDDVKIKGIYWCGLKGHMPSERVQKMLIKKNGFLVETEGFDALMYAIGNEFYEDKIDPHNTAEYLNNQTKHQINKYEEQYKKLKEEADKMPAESDYAQEVKRFDERVEAKEKEREQAGTMTAWDYLRKGNRAYDAKNYTEAIDNYNKAIEKQPDFADAYNNRGVAYDSLGEYNKAIADYNEAIRLKPDAAVAYNNRGNAHADLGEYDMAIADYNEAIRLKPDYADAYYNRGNNYNNLGEYDKAIADYNEAIRLNPDTAVAYNNRGSAYNDLGEYDKAIADYNEAIRLNPDTAVAYNNRGYYYAKKGEYDKAIEDCNKSLKLRPDYAETYDSRGYAYAGAGEHDKAIVDFTKALKINPNLAETYRNRAQAYRAIGETEKAKADEKRAAELEKKTKPQGK